MEQQLDQMAVPLKRIEDQYVLASANKSPLQQAALALSARDPKFWLESPGRARAPRFGLAEKALEALRRLGPGDWTGAPGG